MSGLIGKALRFARTTQGRKALAKAQAYAKSPEGRQKLEDVRSKVAGGKPTNKTPTPHDGPAPKAPGSDVNTATTPKPDPNAPETPR